MDDKSNTQIDGISRRELLIGTVGAGLSWGVVNPSQLLADAGGPSPKFQLSRDVPTRMYDGKVCWCHPRAGVVPDAGQSGQPRVVMTMNTLTVSGSDVFKAVYGLKTDDLSKSWSAPEPQEGLKIRQESIAGVERPVAVSDFWPTWHQKSQTLLGTGHTVVYSPDWKIPKDRPKHVVYSTYDPESDQWNPWNKMEIPGERFRSAGAGCTQRYDLADGTILLPVYYKPPGGNSHVMITHCKFDGTTLKYLKHGNELSIDNETRGLHEPSLTKFRDKYFLTLRNDKRGYVTTSSDGLNYEPYQPWRFDDGEELGNYNTQQHWVTHSDGLFLVYTRRGANNDHVFRHRAPLFIAQVDPDKLCVIRESERILVPERGARLGNFGVTQVSPQETWVTVAEWMQTWGPNHILPVDNKYGSDGSVFVARIQWEKPNQLFSS